MAYHFIKASLDEANEIYALYETRVAWMNEKGMIGWNTTDYLNRYPLKYYENEIRQGNCFVLKDDNKIVGAVVLLEKDDRWLDQSAKAYYIHNFVTAPQAHGAGKMIIRESEKLAAKHNKDYVRLDCIENNEFLNHYYQSLGYDFAGKCQDGPYHGNLREKKLA